MAYYREITTSKPTRHSVHDTRVPTPPRTHQDSARRRFSEYTPATSSLFDTHLADPIPSTGQYARRRSHTNSSNQQFIDELPTTESHRRSHTFPTDYFSFGLPTPQETPTPTRPQKPRDSLIEPDVFPTFTSSTSTSLPSSYTSGFPSTLRLTKYAVHDAATNNALITITRNAVHLPEPFSSKPLLTLLRSATGQTVGSIRFHVLTTSAIDVEVAGVGACRMEHDVHFSKKRWKFPTLSGAARRRRDSSAGSGSGGSSGDEVATAAPLTTTTTAAAVATPTNRKPYFHYWCRHKDEGWELKEGSKKGAVIARIGVAGDATGGLVLRFLRAGLGEREVEEILISAVAVVEAMNRNHKDVEWGDLHGDRVLV